MNIYFQLHDMKCILYLVVLYGGILYNLISLNFFNVFNGQKAT